MLDGLMLVDGCWVCFCLNAACSTLYPVFLAHKKSPRQAGFWQWAKICLCLFGEHVAVSAYAKFTLGGVACAYFKVI